MLINAILRIGVFEIFTILGSVTIKGRVHDQDHAQPLSVIYC